MTRPGPLAAVMSGILMVAACSGDGAPADGATTTGVVGPAPTGVSLVDGLPGIEVLGPPAEEAGDAPRFSWEPYPGAASYRVAVRGPEGPLWAWQGDATAVYLGGLPFPRPAGWAGPVIAAGSCWSVVARDGAGHVIAVSDLLPVSPGQSTGHSCVPGEGEEPSS
jgi:hypothetical protein